MDQSLLFWILMLLWLVLGALPFFGRGERPGWAAGGTSLIIYLLIGILGWAQFGAPIK